jgi:hypothetical protein
MDGVPTGLVRMCGRPATLPVIGNVGTTAHLPLLQVNNKAGNKNKFSRTNMMAAETGDSCCGPIASEMERTVQLDPSGWFDVIIIFHHRIRRRFNFKEHGDILLLLMTTAK